MFKRLREELASIRERDPAVNSLFEIWLTYSGFHAVRS
ncbi:MAG: serine O-acetyltransferase, partial [Oscillospiraceae bacterium]|nr:serine O-acetyltransferase [Oscillospiraceae bacterium]